MNDRNIYVFLIGAVILGALAFYWFEWRPAQIRKECWNAMPSISDYNEKVYQSCLRLYGLEK